MNEFSAKDYAPWFVYWAAILLLGCFSLMLSDDETDHAHQEYCQRVVIHSMDDGLGHRDYDSKCSKDDIKQAREALGYE
jgi:hypothetical protein